jgi:hypothetical protein
MRKTQGRPALRDKTNALSNSLTNSFSVQKNGPRKKAAPTKRKRSRSRVSVAGVREETEEKKLAASVEKDQLSEVLLKRGKRVWADTRRMVGGSNIRDIRQHGIAQLELAIQKNGYWPNSWITLVKAESAAETKTCQDAYNTIINHPNNKSDDELLACIDEPYLSQVSKDQHMILDGQHRCRAVSNLYIKGILKHPFVPALVLSDCHPNERQIMAATINQITGESTIIFHSYSSTLLSIDGYRIGLGNGINGGMERNG